MAAEAILERESVVLWQEYRRSGDVGLRNQLVMRHMGLVYQIVNRYAALARQSYDDMVQEACLGLIRAIERFRPEYGVQFSTYAYPVISGTVKNYLRERRRLAGHPRWEPVGADDGESGGAGASSYQANPGGEELFAPDMLEALAGDAGPDFTDQVLDTMMTDNLIGRLPLMERKIVKHFFYDDLTQREVARIVARSTSRISRILRRALERIRLLLVDIQQEDDRLVIPAGSSGIVVPSIVDAETGLFGPEHLRRCLHREIGRAQAFSAPLTLAVVRPEDDGSINPKALSTTAKLIYQQVRVLDHVFRAGAQELALIFSLPKAETDMVCRRFQAGSSVRVSYVLATHPEDATSARDLLKVALEKVKSRK